MDQLNLHTRFTLYQTANEFHISPDEKPETLIINRQTGKISLNQSVPKTDLLVHNARSCTIYGIIGIKHLISGSYLIVIKNAIYVGTITRHHIFKVLETQILPFVDDSLILTKKNQDWENIYLRMLQSVLKTPSFYFSHNYDLTNTLQRNHDIASLRATNSFQDEAYQYYDKRFLWNDHLMRDFDCCGSQVAKYRLPLVMGFFSTKQHALSPGIQWTLVSRRSVRRAGTRFNSRGIDHDGNVANFVETEQILERIDYLQRLKDLNTSFVQIRGSIPLIWSQKPNYKYKPDIKIHNDDHDSAMKKHFDELTMMYGDISIVSLIDSRGHEGSLAHEFSQRIGGIQKYYNIPYHYFDFHKECGKMRWHRLSILLERLEQEIKSYGFFAVCGNDVIRKQTGIVRSNCIDSLDRTNVVQSMIALCMLQMQYDLFGDRGSTISSYPVFMDTFKNAWADNADALSIQYAGTPALKTDFTRTGQRTYAGTLRDGINSLTRYLENNFFDSYRQDAIDLFLGHVESYPSPLYRPLDLTSYTSTFSLVIVMLTLVALYIYYRW